MKFKTLFILFFVFFKSLSAQEHFFIQDHRIPVLLNPAYAGFLSNQSLSYMYNANFEQIVLDYANHYYSLTYDHQFDLENEDYVGAALALDYYQNSKFIDISVKKATFSLSYSLKLKEEELRSNQKYKPGQSLLFGLEGGVIQRSTDTSFNFVSFSALDQSRLTATIGFGLLYKANWLETWQMEAGFSFGDLNRPDKSLYTEYVDRIEFLQKYMWRLTYQPNNRWDFGLNVLHLFRGKESINRTGFDFTYQFQKLPREINFGAKITNGQIYYHNYESQVGLYCGLTYHKFSIALSYGHLFSDFSLANSEILSDYGLLLSFRW